MSDNIKTYVRDFNLELLMGEFVLNINPKNIGYYKYKLFNSNSKLIKFVIENGGVLVGSRALVCFNIENNYLFERKPADWDFIITEEILYKIAYEFNIHKDIDKKYISVTKSRWTSVDEYSDHIIHHYPVIVNLIVKDELPDFIESNNIRFGLFQNILNTKYELSTENNKHENDIKMIYVKYKNIKEKLKNIKK